MKHVATFVFLVLTEIQLQLLFTHLLCLVGKMKYPIPGCQWVGVPACRSLPRWGSHRWDLVK